jgi:hypothetical protein
MFSKRTALSKNTSKNLVHDLMVSSFDVSDLLIKITMRKAPSIHSYTVETFVHQNKSFTDHQTVSSYCASRSHAPVHQIEEKEMAKHYPHEILSK